MVAGGGSSAVLALETLHISVRGFFFFSPFWLILSEGIWVREPLPQRLCFGGSPKSWPSCGRPWWVGLATERPLASRASSSPPGAAL